MNEREERIKNKAYYMLTFSPEISPESVCQGSFLSVKPEEAIAWIKEDPRFLVPETWEGPAKVVSFKRARKTQ